MGRGQSKCVTRDRKFNSKLGGVLSSALSLTRHTQSIASPEEPLSKDSLHVHLNGSTAVHLRGKKPLSSVLSSLLTSLPGSIRAPLLPPQPILHAAPKVYFKTHQNVSFPAPNHMPTIVEWNLLRCRCTEHLQFRREAATPTSRAPLSPGHDSQTHRPSFSLRFQL